MKKLMIVLCFLMLVGCGGAKEEVPKHLSDGLVSELHSIPPEDKIVDLLSGEIECTDAFTSLEEEAKSSEYIVYGKVIEVSYIVDEGLITTVETLEIIECYQGDLQAGDVLYIQRDGGFCTVEEYIESHELRKQRSFAKENIKELYSDEILEHADSYYFEQANGDSIDSEVGMELVYCLVRSGHYQETGRCVPRQDIRYVKREDGMFEGGYTSYADG